MSLVRICVRTVIYSCAAVDDEMDGDHHDGVGVHVAVHGGYAVDK